MNWLKKNLFLVAGGVVALSLLGFAIYFLLTQKDAVAEVTEQLSAQTTELQSLATHDPHPNQENIESARKEQKKLAEFLHDSSKFFVPVAGFTNIDAAAFKELLQTTISDLEHGAEKAAVHLPAKYDFTFSPQRKSMDFAPDTLVPLAMQVAEIRAICEVLFEARVHALTGLRRAPVAKEDTSTTDYLPGKKPTTNAVTGTVLTPYEIQFQGFSTELAAVLDGFYRSSNCFIVRNIDVQTNLVNIAPEAIPTVPFGLTLYPTTPPAGVAPRAQQPYDDSMQRRYGIGRYARPPPLATSPPPGVSAPGAFSPPRKGPETILDERPFRVTMYLEAARLAERASSRSAK